MIRSAFSCGLAIALAACASSGSMDGPASRSPSPAESGPRVIQPGAPGEPSREVTARTVSDLDMPGWTEPDAEFMAGMIHHHAQALQMTHLIPERARIAAVHQMGLRMEISQRDEIRLMQDWLERRGQTTPQVVLEKGPQQGMMGHAMGPGTEETMDMGGMAMMPGMLSEDQMSQLRSASGAEFDKLFLEFMIQHHQGAITMVRELFSNPGAGQESAVFLFANEVEVDQGIEINRMNQLLAQYR